MGCDIHLFVEVRHKGKWVMSHEVTRCPGAERNYYRFAAIAGVRGDGPEPRGLPEGISESVAYHREMDGTDGHSDSWMTLDEAIAAWQATADQPSNFPEYDFFGVDECFLDGGPPDWSGYRVVFWFDN